MDTRELTAYVKTVKDLEVDLYTCTEVKAAYLKGLREAAPQLSLLSEPRKPTTPTKPTGGFSKYAVDFDIKYFVGFIFIILYGILMLLLSHNSFVTFCSIVILGIGIGLTVWQINSLIKGKEDYERLSREYDQEIKEYEKEMKAYNERKEFIAGQNETKRRQYGEQWAEHVRRTREAETRLDQAREQTRRALQQLYDQDVIFPKYRNLVALSSIYEYLSSGRCSQLEGPAGAYNLYETELRQNTVIGQLSLILNDLSSIRNNQYVLYTELERAKAVIQKQQASIYDQTVLNGYLAETAARAAAAPQMSFGVIF